MTIEFGEDKLIIQKKAQSKHKPHVPVYLKKDVLDELEVVCRETGYSKTALIEIFVEYCLKNLEITEQGEK